jgi:hypothetical protein
VQKSIGKFLASVFWGQTITGAYYSELPRELLTTLGEKIREKRRDMLAKGVLFLQDNTPARKSHIAVNSVRDLEFEL